MSCPWPNYWREVETQWADNFSKYKIFVLLCLCLNLCGNGADKGMFKIGRLSSNNKGLLPTSQWNFLC